MSFFILHAGAFYYGPGGTVKMGTAIGFFDGPNISGTPWNFDETFIPLYRDYVWL